MVLRLAAREFRRSPDTAWPIVLTIALATGFVSTAFAVVDGVLLRPLPYVDAGRLVTLDHAVRRSEIAEWRARLRSTEDIGGAASSDHAVRGLGRSRILRIAFVSSGFFSTVRPQVLAGRLLHPGDRESALVSERVLRESGQRPSAALGTTLTVLGATFTVAGVVPADVGLPEATTDLWLPAEAADAVALVRDDDRRFGLIGRLRPGATLAQVAAEASGLRRALWKGAEAETRRVDVGVVATEQVARGKRGDILLAFLVGGIVILLVSSANVASLLISRTVAREREFAVRLGLGASRQRLALSLFAEAAILATLGGGLGLGLAAVGVQVLKSMGSSALPRLDVARIEVSTMVFCGAASVLVALACTAAPAWLVLRRGVAPLVRSGTGTPGRGGRLQTALAAGQLALAIVLVVTAALLTRTIVNMLDTPTGARVDGVLTARVMLGDRTVLSTGESHAFADRLLHELERLPGVQHAAVASSLPPATSIVQMAIRVVDGPRDETRMMALVAATPAWSEALGVRLVSGRFLRATDDAAKHPVVVVSRSAARHLFGERVAVGLSMPTAVPGTGGRPATVVGVVEDVRYAGLVAPLQGAVYVPWNALPFGMVRLVVRTGGDPRHLATVVAAVARRLDPTRPVEDVSPLTDVVAASVSGPRTYAVVASALGITALGVALVGLLATLSRLVTARRHEFAVRMAVGATALRLVAVVLREAAIVVAVGAAAGIPLAYAAGSGVAAALYGVSATGPDTYVVVGAVTSAVALLSSLWPASRAVSTSPIELLRIDAAGR
jgi:putative ABC transport system permease protein